MRKYFANEIEIHCYDTGEVCTGYMEYLLSIHWKNIRRKRLSDKPMCAMCDATHGLQLHHLTYERLGNEMDSDLVVLCNNCHKKIHGKGKKKRKQTSKTNKKRSKK